MILGMNSAISENAVPYSRKINAHFTIPENKNFHHAVFIHGVTELTQRQNYGIILCNRYERGT